MNVMFGKYRGQPIKRLLADVDYCRWLLDQPWLTEKHPALAERVKERHYPESPTFVAGWHDGVNAVWEQLRDQLTPAGFWKVERRCRGCTCDPELVIDAAGELVDETHGDACRYAVRLRTERERSARRATEQAERAARVKARRERLAQVPRCRGRRANGEPCRAIPKRGEEYCYTHRDQAAGLADAVTTAEQDGAPLGQVIAVEAERWLARRPT